MEIGKLDHQIKGLENFKFDLYGMSLTATYRGIKTLLRLLRRLYFVNQYRQKVKIKYHRSFVIRFLYQCCLRYVGILF